MSDLFEFSRKILKEQPFSTLLGTELTSLVPGEVVLTLAVCEELKQQHEFVHGGVVSYLADNALTGIIIKSGVPFPRPSCGPSMGYMWPIDGLF